MTTPHDPRKATQEADRVRTLTLTVLAAVVLSAPAQARPRSGWDRCHSRACVERVKHRLQAQAIRRVTPYRCTFGRSSIPCYVVMCESRGRWDAWNPSGARGPYQLMGMWGAPWPVRTRADRLAHHRIAARLWNHGRGAGNWACA